MVGFLYGLTGFGLLKFMIGFTKEKTTDPKETEVFFRLNSIFAKNKYGYNTRFMSDFDLLLEGVLNERFIDESTLYYDDEVVGEEIADMERGLNGDFADADVKNLLKDKHAHDSSNFKSIRFPDRVGTNYPKSDNVSVYKTHPSGSKPAF